MCSSPQGALQVLEAVPRGEWNVRRDAEGQREPLRLELERAVHPTPDRGLRRLALVGVGEEQVGLLLERAVFVEESAGERADRLGGAGLVERLADVQQPAAQARKRRGNAVEYGRVVAGWEPKVRLVEQRVHGRPQSANETGPAVAGPATPDRVPVPQRLLVEQGGELDRLTLSMPRRLRAQGPDASVQRRAERLTLGVERPLSDPCEQLVEVLEQPRVARRRRAVADVPAEHADARVDHAFGTEGGR